MTKQSGLRQNLYVDGYDISGDTQSFGKIGGGSAVLEFTGIDKEAFERQGGRRDGGIDAVTYFNPDTDRSHLVLSPMPLTDRIITFFHLQSTDAASLVAKQGNYDPTVAADGALTIAVNAQANGYGLEWGDQLTAGPVTHVAADEEAGFDGAAATAFGLQAYLHVLDFTGTDVTVTVQDSANNADWTDLADGAFTEVTTAPFAERISTARDADVRRYLRVATTGTFTSVTFAVMVVRNEIEVLF